MHFEGILVLVVVSIQVTLFTWIYLRDRQRKFGLWLLGWMAIFVHFAAPILAGQGRTSQPWTDWIRVATLIVAATFFLLSVSEVFREKRERLLFLLFIGGNSIFYLTGLILNVQARWFYLALLISSVISGSLQAVRHYGVRNAHLYFMHLLLLPYVGWATWRAAQGDLEQGLNFYLFGFFGVTGLTYYREFRRFSPGVVFTSFSFLCWGLVFPVSAYLQAHGVGPAPTSLVWDIPKFFVAFGMILTLYESQAIVSSTVATKYQALFEGNLAAVYLSTFDGQLLDCNRAFLKMYGFKSKEEALSESWVRVCADNCERQLLVDALNLHGRVLNHECRHRRKDGTDFWVLERATVVLDPSGERVIEGTAIDITERKNAEIALKESEQRFSAVYRQMPVACGIVSLEGIFLSVNDAFLSIMALTPEQVIGKSGVELGFWKSQEERDEFYERYLKNGGQVQNKRIEFKDAKGNRHVALYCATVVRIGEKDCIFGMMVDQTEKNELEAKFLQAQKMESLGRLAGGVAHDFNNMLGVIGGYAELLDGKLGNQETYRRYCSKILETTQRASGLTRQLLTFSRKEIVQPMPLRTDFAIRELAGILPRLIGEDVELMIDMRAEGTVVMDKTHFEQIILNVVINARDAMPDGGQLFLETEDVLRQVPSANGNPIVRRYVALRIRDTGVGMDEKTRSHAFEPFFTTKEIGRGTGLGLATVYGIVQQVEGDISLDSSPGQGTQVTIFLPAVADLAPEIREVLRQEVRRGAGNILLVEDETDLRNANAEFLSSIGYSVISAGSGPEALRMASAARQIDLAISDVVMPKMNGREFADRLRQVHPNTKLLFVSGYADDVVLQTGLSVQGIPFLQKPYSLRQLGSKVHELLSLTNGNIH
jgi:PAS domain S-box-containing protein